MPELTVAMPAYNTGKFIGEAIQSVLAQEKIDIELIIVDDGSDDNTVAVINDFGDPRIELLQNKKRRGISYCHNRVIAHSQSPYIAHVDSDDVVLDGALRKMVDELRAFPAAGQVHCYFFDIDDKGVALREDLRTRKKRFLRERFPDMDYKRELLRRGNVINHLRIYRKEIFDHIGVFNEDLPYGVDYEMALRIIDNYDIRVVPEFLYCYRVHDNTTKHIRFHGLNSWLLRFQICRGLDKKGQIKFFHEEDIHVYKILFRSLWKILKSRYLPSWLSQKRKRRRVAGKSANNNWGGVLRGIIATKSLSLLSKWPLDVIRPRFDSSPPGEQIIGLYWPRNAKRSGTVIVREVIALQGCGMNVEVFANRVNDGGLFDELTQSGINRTCCLDRIDKKRLAKYTKTFLFRHPIRFFNLLLFTSFRDIDRNHNFGNDKPAFANAVYLAGRMAEKNIDRVHMPCSDHCAVIGLIAARLLNVPFTIHARTFGAHHADHDYGLQEYYDHAESIITDSQSNAEYLKDLLPQGDGKKVNIIYNSLDLKNFTPSKNGAVVNGTVHILTVGRLVEKNGIECLLKAAKLLKDRGIAFKWEVVGEPEKEQSINYYIAVRKSHKLLDLEDHVTFTGLRNFDYVIQKYRETDIFVLPCMDSAGRTSDDMPDAVIEAMAMKLPVISTMIGGIPEIIADGIQGILVPPNDEESLSNALSRLITDSAFRRELGDNGRKRVEEKFNPEKNIRKLVHMFTGGNTAT